MARPLSRTAQLKMVCAKLDETLFTQEIVTHAIAWMFERDNITELRIPLSEIRRPFAPLGLAIENDEVILVPGDKPSVETKQD